MLRDEHCYLVYSSKGKLQVRVTGWWGPEQGPTPGLHLHSLLSSVSYAASQGKDLPLDLIYYCNTLGNDPF